MKDQVIIGPSGQLAVAIPLYRNSFESIGDEYVLTLHQPSRPLAYALDIGNENLELANGEFVEKHAEFLGDL